MSQSQRPDTTIRLDRSVKQRFDDAMPYSSMNASEFVNVLLDEWEDTG